MAKNDEISEPPGHLITLYKLNDYQRFEALVSLPLSGDQKPSHLMNRMLALLPDDNKPDSILRGLFLRCLPINVGSLLPFVNLLSEILDESLQFFPSLVLLSLLSQDNLSNPALTSRPSSKGGFRILDRGWWKNILSEGQKFFFYPSLYWFYPSLYWFYHPHCNVIKKIYPPCKAKKFYLPP